MTHLCAILWKKKKKKKNTWATFIPEDWFCISAAHLHKGIGTTNCGCDTKNWSMYSDFISLQQSPSLLQYHIDVNAICINLWKCYNLHIKCTVPSWRTYRTDASKVPPSSKVPPAYFGKIPEIHLDLSKDSPSNFKISINKMARFCVQISPILFSIGLK